MNGKAGRMCAETNKMIMGAWQHVIDTMHEPMMYGEYLKLEKIRNMLHDASDFLEELEW